jgi:hypothetical protein
VGTGEIKYPGWTKISTAARQLDIDFSRARGRKPCPKITWPSRLGVNTAGHLLGHHKKTRNAKKKPNIKPRKLKVFFWSFGGIKYFVSYMKNYISVRG